MRDTSQSTSERASGTLLGAALVAFGVIAFSAYSFASGEQPKPAATPHVSSQAVRTTPDNPAQRDLPPPVAPSKSE
jgi:hypothetical protein